MCGIFGYTGSRNTVDMVLKGLKKLEYRGYDSAGIAGVEKGKIEYCKEIGKLNVLEQEIGAMQLKLDVAIGHTRWATHGTPSKINAHPHLDEKRTLAIVHNGIIENYERLRRALKERGVQFLSDTDSEVVAHLLASFYKGDLLKAVQEVVPLLEGAYAIAIVHKDHPDTIIAVANQSPLIVGIGKHEAYVSSDANAFAGHANEVIYLANSEIALLKPNLVEVYGSDTNQINKSREQLGLAAVENTKGGFEHYTLKEIHEQPQSILNALDSRIFDEYGTVQFEDPQFPMSELRNVERVLLLACGTSFHAGLIGSYMLEDRARIPSQAEIASEFRYKNPIIRNGTLVIAISQSGETADTIAAVREVKAKGAKVLAICNVPGSTLIRESDASILLRAGPEIGVCSTKAFTSQVTVLALVTALLARMRSMSKQDGQEFLHALMQLPVQVQMVLDTSPRIAEVAKLYAKYDNFFFIGRRYMFPSALEGALKLKEISYINANGYPAGEMKHGPIALLTPTCPVVALCANQATYHKLLSNLTEAKARGAPIIAIAEEGSNGELTGIADEIIWVPKTIDEFAAIPTAVVTQLLAYYIAKERGADIDMPRNLAKSVTVE